MNFLRKTIVLPLAIVLLGSCTKDPLAEQPPVATRLSLTLDGGSLLAQRDTRAVSEGAINDLWVLQFDASGAQLTRQYIASVTNVRSIELTTSLSATANSTLYLVANTGNASLFSTQTLVQAKAVTVALTTTTGGGIPSDGSTALPMVGQSAALTFPISTAIPVNLTRAVAKVILTVENPLSRGYPQLTVQSVQLKNVPKTYSTQVVDAANGFTGTSYYPAASAATFTAYTATTGNVTAAGTTRSYYLAPNVRGISSNSSDRLKSDLTAVSGQGDFCTYVEILGTAKASSSASEVPVRYRLYLGGNKTNNFNLYANTVYTVGIELTGINGNDARMTISTDKFDLIQGDSDGDHSEGIGGFVQPVNPPSASDYVTIDGLQWAKGNLVAKNTNECKVGAPGDYGVYFRFGSLVGWTGGASGDGTGQGQPALDKAVWPIAMGASKPIYASTSTFAYYYFSYSVAPWDTFGQNIRDFAVSIDGALGSGTLADGRYAKLGVGDPCTYYLGAPWRTPTTDEFVALCKNPQTVAYHYYWSDVGGSWTTTPVKGGTFAGTQLFFPASGNRVSDGFLNVTTDGFYWSSSVDNATAGLIMSFGENLVTPQYYGGRRDFELSVRCVSGSYVPPPPTNPPTASDIVTIDGLQWTKGPLVAKNTNECKVGAPADYGVYFQFGSLVGWSGGASGDGTGVTNTSLGVTVQVKPSTYVGTAAWGTVGRYLGGTTADTGYGLPATDAPTTGIGDPCRFYLGAPWRTPTSAEYIALCNNKSGADANFPWSDVGGSWTTTPVNGGTLAGAQLFFPASGNRSYSNGSFTNVTTTGSWWSSSVHSATSGLLLYFTSSWVYPQYNLNRSFGFPVRCVSGTYVPPPPTNPPTASDIVTIDGLQWAKGNLVAKNTNECQVGAPGDYGVYFQFGSLVGWQGGATGDGTGVTNTGLGVAVQVKPSTYVGTDVWTTVGRYTAAGTSGTGYGLPSTDAPTTGIGDPCRFYLGAPWRTPTAVELASITGKTGSSWIDWTTSGLTGRWVTSGDSFDGVSGPGAWFGSPLSAGSGTPSSSVNPFFPASGFRYASSGSFHNVTMHGYFWSSSVNHATNGYNLYFGQPDGVVPQDDYYRSTGFPVRCVSSVP